MLRNAHLFDALISYALKTVNSSECNSRTNKTEKKNKAEKKNDNNQSEKYRITTFTYAFEKKLISIIRSANTLGFHSICFSETNYLRIFKLQNLCCAISFCILVLKNRHF